jgi:hypothetical protein
MTSFIAIVCLLQHSLIVLQYSLVVLLQYSLVVLQYSSIYHESCHLRSVGWQKSGRRFFCISRDHGSWRAFDYSWCRRMRPSFPRRAKTTPSICIQFGGDSHPGAFRMRDTFAKSRGGVYRRRGRAIHGKLRKYLIAPRSSALSRIALCRQAISSFSFQTEI